MVLSGFKQCIGMKEIKFSLSSNHMQGQEEWLRAGLEPALLAVRASALTI